MPGHPFGPSVQPKGVGTMPPRKVRVEEAVEPEVVEEKEPPKKRPAPSKRTAKKSSDE